MQPSNRVANSCLRKPADGMRASRVRSGNWRCGFTAVLSLARPRSASRVRSDDTAPSSTGHVCPGDKHTPPRWREKLPLPSRVRRIGCFRYPQESETCRPSFANSSRMRGLPQVGLSCHIRRISWMSSGSREGRPSRRRDFQRQYLRNPARCQPITVCGWMITTAFSQRDQTARRTIHNSRSGFLNLGLLAFRLNTRSWCRRARFSNTSWRRGSKPAARLRKTAMITSNMIRRICPKRPSDQRFRSTMRFSLPTTSAIYTVSSTQSSDAAGYTVTVTNIAGSVTCG